tara:strand:+ start:1830 stop:2249 length:420 start_codon:yes stop_codon:yes gene_type:complete
MNKNSYKAYPPVLLWVMIKGSWDAIMTIEGSVLRKLDPRVAHMIFLILAFMWSGIFAIMIGSITAFGISAVAHTALISGTAITLLVFNEADKRPDSLNKTVKSFKLLGGYHSFPRARQNMWINGQKVKLDANDPGGEHE